MNKMGVISISIAAALSLSYADADMKKELEQLKKEMAELKETVKKQNIDEVKKELSVIKKNTAGDNIKFSADYRYTVDRIDYKMADGSSAKNDDLMTNRLILGMKAAPREDLSFIGQLSYNKAFGDTKNHAQSNTAPGNANFDWVTNENATDNTIKVKQAYFLYSGNVANTVPYSASIGRRPSTDGLPINLREGDEPQSPLAHGINVEFDGASFGFDFEKLTTVPGLYFKLCLGRGLTNTKPRFQPDGTDYAKDESSTNGTSKDIDMYGFIFKPFDNGQYSVNTSFYWASNLIGYTPAGMQTYMTTGVQPSFADLGLYHGGAITLMANGIGNFWSDFLDNTKVFASWAYSETKPDNGQYMLGSAEKQFGSSWWAGVQIPCLLKKDARIGLEYNQGSKYWRSMTYGEDTMIGSKIAARGKAWEGYYIFPIFKDIFTAELRHTMIDYEYTGSNAFFGVEGNPVKISDQAALTAAGMSRAGVVDKASDTRLSLRYKY